MNAAVMVYKSVEMVGYEDYGVVESLRLPQQREVFVFWINQRSIWDLALILRICMWTVIRGSNSCGEDNICINPDRL